MKERILMTGNEAVAEGAIQAGCRFYAGYPITPQNELTAYMARHMPEAGRIFIQAESELSAVNMVYGAAAAGVRAMTSSSSPGMSLKQEGISYLAGAELPSVIVNMMRGGPGLGNIAPSQSDYFQATRGGGHGDYHSIVIAPSTVQEAFSFMGLAFDLADVYRSPVIILGDGLLGQMMEPISIGKRIAGEEEARSGEGRLPKKNWALTGCAGRAPNIIKSFFLKEGQLEKFNLYLQKKYRRIIEKEQRFEEEFLEGAEVVCVAYGSMARIVKGAVAQLRQKGKKAGFFRPISLWPFPSKGLRQAVNKKTVKHLLVVEMSYGQLLQDVQLAVSGKKPVSFLGRAGGGIPTEAQIIAALKRLLA